MKIVKRLNPSSIVVAYQKGHFQSRTPFAIEFKPDSEFGYTEALRCSIDAVRRGMKEVQMMQYGSREILHNDSELRETSSNLDLFYTDDDLLEEAHSATKHRFISGINSISSINHNRGIAA